MIFICSWKKAVRQRYLGHRVVIPGLEVHHQIEARFVERDVIVMVVQEYTKVYGNEDALRVFCLKSKIL